MSMRDLIATKPMTYGTRRLKAEEPFTARTGTDATVLVALRKARRAEVVETKAPAPKAKAPAKPKPKAKPKAKPAAKPKKTA